MSYILDALKRSEQERHQEKVASINNDMMVLPTKKHHQPLWPYLLILVLLINAGVFAYFSLKEEPKVITAENKDANSAIKSAPRPSTKEATKKNDLPLNREVQTKRLPEHLRVPVQPQKKLPAFEGISLAEIKPKAEVEYTAQGDEIIRPKKGVERITPSIATTTVSGSSETKQNFTTETSEFEIADAKSDNANNSFEGLPLLSEMPLSFQKTMPDIEFSSHIYSTKPDARRAMINNLYLREGDGFSGLVLKEIGEFYVVIEKQGELFKTPVLRDWRAP